VYIAEGDGVDMRTSGSFGDDESTEPLGVFAPVFLFFFLNILLRVSSLNSLSD
jgi:hypothetical protein